MVVLNPRTPYMPFEMQEFETVYQLRQYNVQPTKINPKVSSMACKEMPPFLPHLQVCTNGLATAATVFVVGMLGWGQKTDKRSCCASSKGSEKKYGSEHQNYIE